MIERHIERKGVKDFADSSIVITERIGSGRKQVGKKILKPEDVFFDINQSTMIIMEKRKQETVKMLGLEIKMEDSDEEDP